MNTKNSITSITCPVCSSHKVEIFIEIPQIPVYCNLLYTSREEALSARRADMKLGFCDDCGHVYNQAFNADLMDYTQYYENSLHFSPHFQQYAEKLADRLIERHKLFERDIIEIGCGDGFFLSLLCEKGNNRGVGFDPSAVPEFDITDKKRAITFIRDYYSDRFADYKADMICCRHVLEHAPDPLRFLRDIRRAIGNRRGTTVYFEVPNVLFTLRDLGIWDLIYEHRSYFSSTSLEYLFNATGFGVKDISETFNGQFIGLVAISKLNLSQEAKQIIEKVQALMEYIDRFSVVFHSKMTEWQDRLEEWRGKNKKVVLWGAGSKGATFLNFLHVDDQIRYVVDINPRKNDRFIAGTGQRIKPARFLCEYRPDKIIVMNPVYLEEIGQTVANLNVRAEVVAV
jgi:SAM-dependent methyltransferase